MASLIMPAPARRRLAMTSPREASRGHTLAESAKGESIAYRLLDEEALDGETNLTAICVAAPNRGARGDVEVRIGEDNHGVFAAKLEHRGNQALGAGFRDAAAGRDTSGEQDFVGISIDQSLPDFAAALHHDN